MAEEQISPEPKIEVQDAIAPVDANPPPVVSRKRQSLSDLFTIVSATTKLTVGSMINVLISVILSSARAAPP